MRTPGKSGKIKRLLLNDDMGKLGKMEILFE